MVINTYYHVPVSLSYNRLKNIFPTRSSKISVYLRELTIKRGYTYFMYIFWQQYLIYFTTCNYSKKDLLNGHSEGVCALSNENGCS